MTFLEAALEILRRERKPLHYKDITSKAMDKKLLTFVGRTPEVTMQTQLTAAVKKTPGNPFVRVKPGTFGLLRYPEAPVSVPEERPAAPAKAAAAAKSSEEGTDGEDRGRRRRRGGRGRARRDDAVDVVTAPEAKGAAPARARASEEAASEDDEEAAAVDGPEEPEIGSMSAEDRAAALAESGVLSALDNDEDDASEEDDDEDEDEDEEDDESSADDEDEDDDDDEDEEEDDDEEVEEALPADNQNQPLASGEGASTSASDLARGPLGPDDGDDNESSDDLEAIDVGQAPGASVSGAGAFAGVGGDLGAQVEPGGFEDSPGGRRRRRRRRRRGGGGLAGEAGLSGDSAGSDDVRGTRNVPAAVEGPEGEGALASGSGAGGDAASLPPSEGSDSGASRRIMSPVDAAIEILRGQAPGRGMHVRQLADAATRRRLVHGEANEAWRVMRAALAAEPRERLRAGQRPRVRSAGSGLFALSRRPPDLDLERAEHVFGEARRALRERTLAGLEQRLVELAPSGFEAIARVLLQREGFGPATFVKRVEGTVYLEALRGRGIRPSRCLIALRPGGVAAGRRAVGELRAGIRARNQDEGVLLLGARLAEDGVAEWKQPGPPIEVADGAALAETCLRHGVGVINTMVSVDFVDADFFADMQEG